MVISAARSPSDPRLPSVAERLPIFGAQAQNVGPLEKSLMREIVLALREFRKSFTVTLHWKKLYSVVAQHRREAACRWIRAGRAPSIRDSLVGRRADESVTSSTIARFSSALPAASACTAKDQHLYHLRRTDLGINEVDAPPYRTPPESVKARTSRDWYGFRLFGWCSDCGAPSRYWADVKARRAPKPAMFDIDLAALMLFACEE